MFTTVGRLTPVDASTGFAKCHSLMQSNAYVVPVPVPLSPAPSSPASFKT